MIVTLVVSPARQEQPGLKLGIGGFLLSLVVLQALHCCLPQFSALMATLLQLALHQIVLAYRRWYLAGTQPLK